MIHQLYYGQQLHRINRTNKITCDTNTRKQINISNATTSGIYPKLLFVCIYICRMSHTQRYVSYIKKYMKRMNT